ncbi:hypothetical protein ISN45_Aa04g006990 [Arabidopsis thaliana x Arabidopsis arenosa]|uniref:KIB1-4 beta-propeller domain-containing protein n=1 Tax=Arabidopsis thaliana x Arabidopsis arenosa TaxID=1240361 RepID=A0A8T2A830_9BRAS|nr:hypothetical protein ISN45_Aa04g006990 [Arabidopsis thaliana x Arabidopsis arenosa]
MKVKIARSDPTLINMLDCQIQISVAFLLLNKDGGEIVVFLMQLKKISNSSCHDLVTFIGRFYAVFLNGNMFVIDRVSRLDDEAGQWVEDLRSTIWETVCSLLDIWEISGARLRSFMMVVLIVAISEFSSLKPKGSQTVAVMCSSENMVKPARIKISSMMPDWSQLPDELLNLISKNLDNCFDVLHARSVCSSVRTPAAALPSAYFLGGIGRDESEDHMELPSPLQCSVRVKIQGSDPTLMNILDCQIVPLGYQYRMMGWDPEDWATDYRGVAFLPLNKEGGGEEFVVLLNYTKNLYVLRSTEMRWMKLKVTSDASCSDLVAFRGRFYAAFLNGDIFIFDPYSMQRTPLVPSEPRRSSNYLIPSGNDELFLVEKFNPFPECGRIDFKRFICRVSRLDEEAGKWVVVSDLGDRVLFIGHFGNVCCSAKELPDDCGVSGNSILFTNMEYRQEGLKTTLIVGDYQNRFV